MGNRNNYNETPLHKTVHWRRLKEIISEICAYEKIDTSNYNMNKITCYRTFGDEMKGPNVKYNIRGGTSCWVSDNKYEIFEIPKLSNKGYAFTGNFIFIAHNVSFDYWLFGTMSVKLDMQDLKVNHRVNESVYFNLYGKYLIASNRR